jgi:transcriptional regulator with XRE-family HTH domain
MKGIVAEKKGREFGDLILEKRKEKNLSLQKLSNVIGGEITPSYINRLEKKEKGKPSFDVVCQLTQALEMDLAEVFSSFGYSSMMPSAENQQADITFTDHKGHIIAIECKTSPRGFTNNQYSLLQETVNSIVEYEMVEEEVYGFIPKIVQLVEDFRKDCRT